MTTTFEAAQRYLDLGWVLTPIPLKSKAPRKVGWNTPKGWVDSVLKARVDFRQPGNLGVILGPSKLCVFDVDSVSKTRIIFEEYGFSYDAIMGGAPRIRGAKLDRDKAIFRYPEGETLKFHKLIWGANPKETTVFELRCGLVQDVLPPSVHPEGHNYEWIRDPFSGIPELPAELLGIWKHFPVLEEQLKKIDPNRIPEPRPKPQTRDGEHGNIIGQFNQAHDLEAILSSFGYVKRGKRYLSPSSTTKIPGVLLFADTPFPRCVSKHGDSLNDGHAHDAFDVFRILKHGGDFTAAVRAAGQILGVKWEPNKPKPQTNSTGTIHIRSNSVVEMDEMFADIDHQRNGRKTTIDTPWELLTERSRAFRPASVCLLAGPSKAGKSYLIMTVALFLHRYVIPWKYLPLEDSRKDWMWRALALKENDYDMTDDRLKTADKRELAFIKNSGFLESVIGNVFQNPRVGNKDRHGNTVIPPLPYEKIIGWVRDNAKDNRVLILDPFAQIEFPSRTVYEDQAKLIRGVLGLVADTECTLIINIHTVKKTNGPLTIGDVQGSADLVRLVHSILLFDAHDFRQAAITNAAGGNETVSHNRTLTVSGTRNGPGAVKLAFTQGLTGPSFVEHGIITEKKETKQ